MRPARTLTFIILMTIAAGFLTSCARGSWRKQSSTSEKPSFTPKSTSVTMQPPSEPTEIVEQTAIATTSPTQPTATEQTTLVDDTIGDDLENLLEQLYNTNIAGDDLEDVK